MLSANFQKNSERKVFTTEILEEFEKIKNENPLKTIAVHSGTFHGDDVLSSLLMKFHPDFKETILIRSRNDKILNQCDAVLDVGSKFDPKTLRFDHHMKDFTEKFSSEDRYKDIKLSSAGLVYKFLGKEIITNILKALDLYEQNTKHIDEIFNKVYDSFILAVDANDNGVSQYETNVEAKYDDDTKYSNRIARLNPEWNNTNCNVNERFQKGWDIAEEELYYHLIKYANSYFIAYDIVQASVDEALRLQKKYIVIDSYCPWLKILSEIEGKLKMEGYFLFGIVKRDNGEWTVRGINLKEGGFELRKALPKEWRGKREEELRNVSGIEDAIFVHVNGFIGFFKSKESAIKVAEIAINEK